MVDRNWHNQLQQELARQGLPRLYTERLMDELLDHALCLKEETNVMDATKIPDAPVERVGKPEQLAQAAGEEYRRRTWLGRHPILTFLIAPLPMLVLSWILCMLVFVCTAELVEEFNDGQQGITKSTVSSTTLLLMETAFYIWAAAPFVLTTCLLCWMAQRTARGPKWMLAAGLIVTLVAAVFHSQMALPTQPGNGQLSTGFGFPAWGVTAVAAETDTISFATNRHLLGRILFPLLPFAVCGLFLWRNSRGTPRPPMLTQAAPMSASH
ncbi:hypothetical protein CA54_02260 [Symmachiella macrocystis]|uniref:Uncharacterized protein n=1 Tax=Symmachiella macrocystis TaxID=2527985 RepID=A0A5C6BJR2_9PLAN|nr:hypothetical protein [Symmachiella macrocystis]TWU11419.1 hypothetical protein CA54_02260 [Symmachiella macrocystis]